MDEQTTAEAVTTETTETDASDGAATMDEALGSDGELIDEIERSLSGAEPEGEAVSRMELVGLEAEASGAVTMRDMDLLGDVEVEVSVEFGRAQLPLRQLLSLERGSLVELDRQPEQQVTVLANGTPIALGDIVIVDGKLGIHIVELIDPTQPAETYSPKVEFEPEDGAEESGDGEDADEDGGGK